MMQTHQGGGKLTRIGKKLLEGIVRPGGSGGVVVLRKEPSR